MKKTKVTFITSRGQCILVGLLLLFGAVGLQAQVGPNCTNINASIDEDGYATILVSEFVTNCADAEPVDYVVHNQYGGVVTSATGAACDDEISIYACNALGQTYKINVSNAYGACWTELTFKQSNGPIIPGNTYYLYCLEEEVSDVGLYLDRFYGDNDDKYEPYEVGGPDYKTGYIPCRGNQPVEFIADWVDPHECVLGDDTAKVIYREFEAFDKEGRRGSAFDTIYVWRLPELTADNIYCAEKDTVYCGEGDSPGPYMVVPQIDSTTGLPTGECDTLPFLSIKTEGGKLVCEPNTFDPKCGIAISVNKWEFEDICSPQYKVQIEIKQSCYGAAQTACTVTPPAAGPGTPNAFAPAGEGYWICDFWIIDFDTVAPLAEIKYDQLAQSSVAWYYSNQDEEHAVGDVPLHCYGSQYDDPTNSCIAPLVIVNSTTHECAGHTYIPPICVYDDWSGIKQVKARIEGVGSWVLTSDGEECDNLDEAADYFCDPDYNVKGVCYAAHQTVKLGKSEEPYRVMYEIYDNCHNIDTVYAYMLVKDRTKPVVVADKGVIVNLSSKKVWVDAETFDEGSWDNCGVNMLLARRADWYDFCIDLCDDIDTCSEGPHGDLIWTSYLEEDKHVDEVEAHYAKTIEWLSEDGVACGNILANAWRYDLMKYATLNCVEHPYEVDNQYFRHVFEQAYYDWFYARDDGRGGNGNGFVEPEYTKFFYDERGYTCFDYWDYVNIGLAPGCEGGVHSGFGQDDLSAEIDLYEQIGGGWSDAVPFDCTDACENVTVEILVMDYWCNWAKAWTNVWVEDKTPVTVAKDVVDGSIYCSTYKLRRYEYPGQEHPVSAEWIVEQAAAGEQDAYDALDDIFGGYEKAWVDPYGKYVDADGEEIDCDIVYDDSTCECTTYQKQIRVYDEHLGYLWVDSTYTECFYDDVERDFQRGIVAVNCAENVQCSQTVWRDFDHCGQGYIYRKFKIWQHCDYGGGEGGNEYVDTLYRVQKIAVGNECYLRKEMFDVPGDMEVYSCGIEYDEDGSGNVSGAADPSVTGYPEYKFDDDCRIVGIAHEDQVFKIVGGDAACYKIIRTWYFADWCTQGGEGIGRWWKNGYNDKCVQKLIVIDTMPPSCTITGPVEDGGVISAAGCEYDYTVSVDVTDACGVIGYYWELKDVSKDPHEVVETGQGELNSETEDNFSLTVEGLGDGDYKLKVRGVDECQNESYCEHNFTLETGKKPTPVCITSLTVELTPWDLDSDGDADTAAAEVWAYEFDRSSQAPCGAEDEELDFRIEFLGDDGDSLDLDEDLDVLNVGCEHAGTQMVRLWVISPTGSYDYCDVLLIVQTNMGGCGDVSRVRGVVTTELEDNVEQVEVVATLESGQVLNGVTDIEGAYLLSTTVLGDKVTVTPKKDIGYDNGVSTLDLVKIQKHILGKSQLENEMREMAADVNVDGKISALDLLEIRKLILGKIDRFEKVGSWRFMNKIDNKSSYEIENLSGLMTIDWTGIKMADVDLSNDPSRSAGRSGKSLVFNVDDVELIAGNQYRVEFKANNFNDISGYQFTLNYDANKMKVLNVEGGVLSVDADNFGLDRMEEGFITTSWNAAEGMSIASGEVVFSVVVEATTGAVLSDALAINSRITNAEAYNSADQIHDVSVQYTRGGVERGFALYQNEPNPFKEVTQIGFHLPESMSASLTVYDVTGKVLKVVEGDYSKGYNQIGMKKSDLKVSGVLYYQLDTEAYTATKKMIVVE